MKVTIGITTFNRKKYLVKHQQSLNLSQNIDSCNIRIFDDCSTELDIADLKSLFPNAVTIIQRDKNMGPDRNLRQMYLDFLTTQDDILVTMDSDLICRPDWLNFTEEHFNHTKGIMSLYNSRLHRPMKKLKINKNVFLEKNHIGAAGSIMSREIINEIVKNLPPSDSFDWAWSNFLRSKGIPLLVSNESYFQHIGLQGFNCDGIKIVEYGLNFNPTHEKNQKFITEYQQEYIKIRQG
ncbi:glycosyltransferase involved in cell wall biosynthesis [Bacillus sp. SLBN-46]|uniref:glycosyltransferase family 2 protein n=1 Tax=Bacillus sp. SLBN-46 TaxID=3042283 RepID=UPI00285617E1|nr:glycosyltransferase [Bacillus sp. SLBN-46]MDR6123327.1 glycosyltransferase involved in cell wall biosynthesis [Bacillus sp. SLBN-46]